MPMLSYQISSKGISHLVRTYAAYVWSLTYTVMDNS